MNKLDSGSNYDVPPAFIDTLVWEALNEYIEIFYSGNTKNYQIAFETTQQRMDFLKDFINSYPDIPALLPFDSIDYNGSKLQRTDLSTISYRHFLKGSCKDGFCGKIIPLEIETLNNLDNELISEFKKPSLKWLRAFAYVIKNTLYTYSENNLSEIYLTYIKTPIKPFFGGYNTLEFIQGDLNAPNITSNQVNVELSKDYANILVDIMTELASNNINDFNKGQVFQQKINLV
jgi:hypothetical protein